MFSVIKQQGKVNFPEAAQLVADTTADVTNLPHIEDGYNPGSECFVITPPSHYMLGHDDVWHCIDAT